MHPVDAELASLRQRVEQAAELYQQFTATGRELAQAESDLGDAKHAAPAAPERRRKLLGKRPTVIDDSNDPSSRPSIDELTQRVESLRAARADLSDRYQGMGGPADAYAALVEEKIQLLAGLAGGAGDAVRALLANRHATGQRIEVLGQIWDALHEARNAVGKLHKALNELASPKTVGFAAVSLVGVVDMATKYADINEAASAAAAPLCTASEALVAFGSPPLVSALHVSTTPEWLRSWAGVEFAHGELGAAVGWTGQQRNDANRALGQVEAALKAAAESTPLPI